LIAFDYSLLLLRENYAQVVMGLPEEISNGVPVKHHIFSKKSSFFTSPAPRALPFLLMTASCVSVAHAQCPALDKAAEARIDTLLSKMSLAEKVGQMRIFHAKAGLRNLAGESAIRLDEQGKLIMPDSVRSRLVTGIAGVKNPGEFMEPATAAALTNALQAEIITASPNRIPALFVGEAYNGLDAKGTTKFSRPIALASSWNPDLVGKVWDVIGREARLRGFHMIHSPVADIHRDPRFGRMSEGYGEDTYLTTAMVIAAVRGVQGNQTGLKSTHIGAVTKHFVGYGQVDGGRNFASININPRDLIDQYFPPFKAAVQDGCTLGMMPSHGDINGVASHGNRWLLSNILRKEWGFDGYIVSDAEDVARLGYLMGVAEDDKASALLGLKAGVDIDLYSDRGYANLPELAAKDPGLIPAIDAAARNVLGAKMRLGLFDKPFVDAKAAANGTRTKTALDLALKLDLESAILLKNENGILPLDISKQAKIALIGPMLHADSKAKFEKIFGPKVSFVADTAIEVTNRDAAQPRLADPASNIAGMERAAQLAKDSDLVILFVGDDEFTAREAFFVNTTLGDRASLDLAGQQNELFRAVSASGKPVIVVLRNRRTLSINEIAEKADAILNTWEQSEQGDEATAMLLTGKANPSGRLPVTVPRSAGHFPYHYSQKRINYTKGYLFEKDGPLYPFGYGLSYTSFSYGDMKLSGNAMRTNAPITASVMLRNTGSREGQEVVQLYISDPIASVTRPIKELKGFQKITLKPSETREVSFKVTPDMLVHTGADMQSDPGYGAFNIEIAPSSAGGGVKAEAEHQP
jgi:beta-glucosidase